MYVISVAQKVLGRSCRNCRFRRFSYLCAVFLWYVYAFRRRITEEMPYFQLFTEVFPHPITPVGLSRAVPDLRDLIRNFPVTISALLLFPPRIIAAARYIKQLTHFGNAVFIFEPFDHSVLQTHLLPASHRKFRSSSFSIRSFTSSLFRFVSSVSGVESLRGRPFGRGT